MLHLSEFEQQLDLSEVTQHRVYNDLLDIHFTLFGTIQFNAKSLNTSLIEKSFNLVKEVKQSIQNDFSGRYEYFVRPAICGTWHYHFLIKTRRPMNFKRSKRAKFKFNGIKSNYGFEKYVRFKNQTFESLKTEHGFPAAQFDLQRPLTEEDRMRCCRYVVYNKHTPDKLKSVDFKKNFSGDSNFCYHTNIWKRV